MNIEARIIELVRMILNTEKPAVLAKIAGILKQEEADWREGLPDEVIESVKRGLEQAKAGNTFSHDNAMNKYRKWL